MNYGVRRGWSRQTVPAPYFDLSTWTLVLYDSEVRGDPATPIMDWIMPPYGRDPYDSAEVLAVLNATCYHLNRYPLQAPFIRHEDAWEWLNCRCEFPGYFANGEDVLMVHCPLCRVVSGSVCTVMRSVTQDGLAITYKMSPHTERVLWYRGQHNRGLLNPPNF